MLLTPYHYEKVQKSVDFSAVSEYEQYVKYVMEKLLGEIPLPIGDPDLTPEDNVESIKDMLNRIQRRGRFISSPHANIKLNLAWNRENKRGFQLYLPAIVYARNYKDVKEVIAQYRNNKKTNMTMENIKVRVKDKATFSIPYPTSINMFAVRTTIDAPRRSNEENFVYIDDKEIGIKDLFVKAAGDFKDETVDPIIVKRTTKKGEETIELTEHDEKTAFKYAEWLFDVILADAKRRNKVAKENFRTKQKTESTDNVLADALERRKNSIMFRIARAIKNNHKRYLNETITLPKYKAELTPSVIAAAKLTMAMALAYKLDAIELHVEATWNENVKAVSYLTIPNIGPDLMAVFPEITLWITGGMKQSLPEYYRHARTLNRAYRFIHDKENAETILGQGWSNTKTLKAIQGIQYDGKAEATVKGTVMTPQINRIVNYAPVRAADRFIYPIAGLYNGFYPDGAKLMQIVAEKGMLVIDGQATADEAFEQLKSTIQKVGHDIYNGEGKYLLSIAQQWWIDKETGEERTGFVVTAITSDGEILRQMFTVKEWHTNEEGKNVYSEDIHNAVLLNTGGLVRVKKDTFFVIPSVIADVAALNIVNKNGEPVDYVIATKRKDGTIDLPYWVKKQQNDNGMQI